MKHYYKPVIDTRQRNHNFKHSITQQLLRVKLWVPLRMFPAKQFLAPPFHPNHGHFLIRSCHPAPRSGTPLSAGGRGQWVHSNQSIQSKWSIYHANSGNAQRYFMCIFQLYRQLCPKDTPSHTFYPKPSHCPTSTCWYYKIPRGHSTLSLTVGHLCKLAGIKRYYTNHSLQATVTSRLYQYVVDE